MRELKVYLDSYSIVQSVCVCMGVYLDSYSIVQSVCVCVCGEGGGTWSLVCYQAFSVRQPLYKGHAGLNAQPKSLSTDTALLLQLGLSQLPIL